MFESTLFYQLHSESCSPSLVSPISNIFQPCNPLIPFCSFKQCIFLQFLIACVAMTTLRYVVVDRNWKDLSAIVTVDGIVARESEELKRLSYIKAITSTSDILSFNFPRKFPSL